MKVIVVCDEPFANSTISTILGRAGHVIERVGSATAAQRLTADITDIVVIDWLLEHVDGTTLVRSLRERFGRTPALIMISALSEEAARSYARRVGADEYVTKPLSEDVLLAALGRWSRTTNKSTTGFTVAQRALFSHVFWSKFEAHAAKHVADFVGASVEGVVTSKPLSETGWHSASLVMHDVASSLEVEVTLECSRLTGMKLARPLFRDGEPDDAAVREMLGEMCNTILGRAKGAFRLAGFRFTLSLPGERKERTDFPAAQRACLTGSFGALYAVIAARPLRTAVLRSTELRENMVLAEDVKSDTGEVICAAGTKLTASAVDRLIRHLALRTVKVSLVVP